MCETFLTLIMEASSFSKKHFLEWVKGAIFTPASGLNIEVCEPEFGSFPRQTCDTCKETWSISKLPETTKDVKWHLVKEKKDVAKLVCGWCVITYPNYTMSFCHRMVVSGNFGMLFGARICMVSLMVCRRH